MFACFLSTPSCLLLTAVLYVGAFSTVGPWAQSSTSRWSSARVSLLLEQESLEEHVYSPGFILGDLGGRRGRDGRGPVGLIPYCPQPLTMSLASYRVLHKYLLSEWLWGICGREEGWMWRGDGKVRSVAKECCCSLCYFSDRLLPDCSGSCNQEARLPGPQTKLTGSFHVFVLQTNASSAIWKNKRNPENDWQTKQT